MSVRTTGAGVKAHLLVIDFDNGADIRTTIPCHKMSIKDNNLQMYPAVVEVIIAIESDDLRPSTSSSPVLLALLFHT